MPRKQRKYRANAPLHVKRKMVSAHLDKELRKKHGIRSIPIRKGDKVVVLRGTHRGKEGSVESVNTGREIVHITGIDLVKKSGSKSFYPIKVSNIMIKELNMADKKRKKKLERLEK